jgi:hypothetical protein
MEPSVELSTLVVLESGVRWRGQRMAASTGAGRIVVIQSADEEPATLASRVSRRLQNLQASGGRIEAAVLGFGDRWDEAAFTARARIARAAATVLGGTGCEQILVSAPRPSSSEGHRRFWALLSELMDARPRPHLGVSLCFGDGSL